MSRNGSKRVSFSADINEKPTASLRSNTDKNITGHRKRVPGNFTFRLCRDAGYLPVRFFRYFGANMARALRIISRRSSSAKVSSESFTRRFAPPQDSHHTEAIEDCIEFINSSYKKSC